MLLYDQVVRRSLDLNVRPRCPADFRSKGSGRTYLDEFLVLVTEDETSRARAVEFFIRGQEDLSGLEEAHQVKTAYYEAKKLTSQLKLEIRRILLLPTMPADTACDACEDLVGTESS